MIQSRAMLAQLSISQWTARKQDKKVSAEVEAQHGAHDAGKYNKLLVNKALLDPISKVASKVRDYHYGVTLPWSDAGALLPSTLFIDYTAKMRAYKAEFQAAVNTMVSQYPAEVQAARVRLGTMYNPADYPMDWELKDRFNIALEFTPVPDAHDFRVDVSNEAQDELRESVKQSVADRQADAVKATFARVRDVVSKIAERLSIEDAIFKDTLVYNARDLCLVLKALNITDDPALDAVHAEITQHLLKHPDAIRRNPGLRRDVAAKAAEILKTLP